MTLPSPARHSRLLNLLGLALGLAGMAFVGFRLFAYRAELDDWSAGTSDYAIMAAIALTYAGFSILLVLAWRLILTGLGCPIRLSLAYRIYALSQLAKYVPGNIFQFAGRQALGLAAGIGNAPLAKSTFYELLSLVVSGLLFSPLAAPGLIAGFPVAGSVLLFLAGIVAVVLCAGKIFGRRGVFAIAFHIGFLGLAALTFAAVLALIDGQSQTAEKILLASSGYVLAWLAGLLTPGSPAGLGVREAVLLILLADVAPVANILVAIVAGRVVTVLGDLVFFLAGCILPRTGAPLVLDHRGD